MGVIGAVLGDIAGSRLEYDRPNDFNWENCDIFTEDCRFTDDTVMTLAIKKSIDSSSNMITTMQEIGRHYTWCGYGKKFFYWIHCKDPYGYNSFGNGSAMRVSYIGEYFDKKEDVISFARQSALISHNHPEGVKGAVVTAVCIWMAKNGYSKEKIYSYILDEYPPKKYQYSGKNMEYLRKNYSWDITCMTCVPVALRCFYESNSYIEFIRNVFSLNCDTDTICAIGGGIAEEYYQDTGFNNVLILKKYLSDELFNILYKKGGLL